MNQMSAFINMFADLMSKLKIQQPEACPLECQRAITPLGGIEGLPQYP